VKYWLRRKNSGKVCLTLFSFCCWQVKYIFAFTYVSAIEQELRLFYVWLAAPHPTDFLLEAQKLRQNGTGRWFIEGEDFAQWKTIDASVLWLCGIRKSQISLIVGKLVLMASQLEVEKPL
jgi:hypothetical protein